MGIWPHNFFSSQPWESRTEANQTLPGNAIKLLFMCAWFDPVIFFISILQVLSISFVYCHCLQYSWSFSLCTVYELVWIESVFSAVFWGCRTPTGHDLLYCTVFAMVCWLQLNPRECIAMGPDYEYPLRQSVHLSMFYTLRCVHLSRLSISAVSTYGSLTVILHAHVTYYVQNVWTRK